VVAVGWYGEILPAGVHKGAVPREYLHDKDQAVMVYVPAGCLQGTQPARPTPSRPGWRGTLRWKPHNGPLTSTYYMDKFEVTNQQCAQFLALFRPQLALYSSSGTPAQG
jgi:hypothetical protein